jgi:hypothetical protein
MIVRVIGFAGFLTLFLSALLVSSSARMPSKAQFSFTTARVSVSSLGREANGESPISDLSADERYVVFFSGPSNEQFHHNKPQ